MRNAARSVKQRRNEHHADPGMTLRLLRISSALCALVHSRLAARCAEAHSMEQRALEGRPVSSSFSKPSSLCNPRIETSIYTSFRRALFGCRSSPFCKSPLAQSFGPEQVIPIARTKLFSATDLDGDGDTDVLSASRLDNKIAWYENQGGGAFGSQQVITTEARYANTVYAAADLDGDGDADVSCRLVGTSTNGRLV